MSQPRPTNDPNVIDNSSDRRYEIRSGGDLAGFAMYRLSDDTVTFTHTEIVQKFDAKGLGSRLARAALDDVRARDLQAIPLCPFIAGWIGRHPEYVDLVDKRYRQSVQSQ